MDTSDSVAVARRIRDAASSVLLGKAREVNLCVASFLVGGHILLDDIPGTGKTTLARALARAVSGTFRRIQFTADLLPQDVVGVHVFHASDREFVFAPGPLFANVVLADEINRGNPRVQSALLEAMGERQVSVDARTYPLPNPFLVVATQNPFETHGTYPLPESQMDRFNIRLRLSYPDTETERRILGEGEPSSVRDAGAAVATPEEVVAVRDAVGRVTVSAPVLDWILRIVKATRENRSLRLGASPRAAIGLKGTAQALALLAGRDFVIPEDVREAVVPSLAHRVFLSGAGGGGERAGATDAVVEGIAASVDAPL